MISMVCQKEHEFRYMIRIAAQGTIYGISKPACGRLSCKDTLRKPGVILQ
jgi:hypothetical protein